MQIDVSKPSTVYIAFKDNSPKKFKLFRKTQTVNTENNMYSYRYLNGNIPRIKFNVPDTGSYYSFEDFEVIKIVPIETPDSYPVLPPAERNRLKPTVITENPALAGKTPARIFTDTGEIEVSPDFYTYPITVRLFLLLHEQSHFFYNTEEYCDMMAMINFLRQGYNASMAYYSLAEYLKRSKQNIDRLKFIFNQLQQTQKTSLL